VQTPTITRVADTVLRVDPAVPISIGRELRRATGQVSLRVVFPLAEGSGYVDAEGEPFELPSPESGRVLTPIISAEGRVEAMVVHDGGPAAAITLDPGIVRAGALSAANARLQAELRRHVAEVRASRRRVLEAEQAERRRVRDRLAAALLPALSDIEAGVARLDGGTAAVAVGPREPDAPRASAILASVDELRRALDSVTEGLYPAIAGERGLVHAVQQAAERCPVTTTVTTAGLEPRLDPSVAATAWYVCSEALTNVAKHARASRARVEITMGDGRLVVLVEDDGIGGAEPAAGSGLRGLADRLEAMGGTLRVEPAGSGSGTRVVAHLPVPAAS
jgi:glucose-6-phosphate-specific signal transduction histidine kinase